MQSVGVPFLCVTGQPTVEMKVAVFVHVMGAMYRVYLLGYFYLCSVYCMAGADLSSL